MSRHASARGSSQRTFRISPALALPGIALAGSIAILAWFLAPPALTTPPPLAQLDADPERGAYLARVANCETCHTTEGGRPFAGGRRFETDFGTVFSSNITSSEDQGIGGWSFKDFHRSMRHGIDADGRPLYPAFPYTSFAALSDDDIASLYVHLKSIPPADAVNRDHQLRFPFGLRFLLHPWNRLFHDPQPFTADETKSEAWNRGAYLVQGPAHCGACHTPRNPLGAERKNLALTGGTLRDRVITGDTVRWYAIDLTPASDGLGRWSESDIVSFLTKGQNDHAVVHGPMSEVFANSTRFLEQEDAAAIATYLKSLPPHERAGRIDVDRDQLELGEVLYTVHCGTCHLPDGDGAEGLGVSLKANPVVRGEDPSSLINTILYGPDLPPPPFVTTRTTMRPFGKRLSDEDIAAIATYLRASFGNEAAPVTEEDVTAQR